MRILLAEDETVMAMAIQTRLKNEGFDVMRAADGREAMQLLESGSPDMVITDILMPYTSGLELIAVIREKKHLYGNIPIIVLSALGQESTIMEAFQIGADDFLTKPLNPAELTVRVKRFFNIPIS